MGKFVDIAGKKFNRLTAVKFVRRKKDHYLWLFRCKCGKEKIMEKSSVIKGRAKSCGCLCGEINAERIVKLSFKHGFASRKHRRFYMIFNKLRRRCNSKNDPAYNRYGGRDIECLWKSFEEFRDDMYKSYKLHIDKFGEKNTSVDRIDNNGNYCKENCKWSTSKEQALNRRSNIVITFDGKTQCLSEWSKEKNIKYYNLRYRIKQGWNIKDAFNPKLRINQFI